MRSVLTAAACIGLALSTGSVPLLAQLHDNSEKQLTCANAGYDSDRARHCEIREQSLASIGRLTIDPGQNGGATVKGWMRGDVLVRTRVEASADTEAASAIMASGAIRVDPLISAVAPLEEGPAWFDRLYRHEAGLMKVILRP